MAVRKVHQNQVARKKLPSRYFRELVSHRKLKSRSISLRLVELTPVKKAGPRCAHSHRGMEEVIYVQKGSGKTWVDGRVTRIRAGDAILIPAGVRHMTINTGKKPLTLLCVFSAPDPENRYREHPDITFSG